jgi:ubiquinone/menaquinone biosynthesis C-methylase UbiE
MSRRFHPASVARAVDASQRNNTAGKHGSRSPFRPPRAVAFTILVASAGAVALAGVAGTLIILATRNVQPAAAPPAFWPAFAGACALSIGSIGIRALRWVFLMRRSNIRIPIRDAMIGYFSGLSLLFVPLLVGEIATRAYVQRARAHVTPTATVLVNIWERLLDALALALILGVTLVASAESRAITVGVVAVVIALLLQLDAVWFTAITASIAAWLLPGIGLWTLTNAWTPGALRVAAAEQAFAASSLFGATTLAPAGVLVVGQSLLDDLAGHAIGPAEAALIVFALRVATVGVATALGAIFVAVHLRTRPASTAHFDAIAHAYDAQIPEARRVALLARKTTMMAAVLQRSGAGRRGLDVGCGQGWYVRRMRELGFDVAGIDMSPEQVASAARNVDDPAAVTVGSALDIPSDGASYDFVYTINVLHHLSSVDEQRRAFTEIARVLKPGGLLFVHEINTRNLLFRFYMGYVFPTLNCIDEGVERWLLPHRLGTYTAMPVRDVSYFTFLPEFMPPIVLRLLAPFERLLEQSPVRVYSAHYMAVLQKPMNAAVHA